MDFNLNETAPGVYEAPVSLPVAGHWNLVLQIRKGEELHEIQANTRVEDRSSVCFVARRPVPHNDPNGRPDVRNRRVAGAKSLHRNRNRLLPPRFAGTAGRVVCRGDRWPPSANVLPRLRGGGGGHCDRRFDRLLPASHHALAPPGRSHSRVVARFGIVRPTGSAKSFVRVDGEHTREAALILEGIVCAACVWLNERHVNALPGVLEFRVNYSTHRARLCWDERQIKLSQILEAITAIGYVAHPFDPSRQEALQKRERAVALRRLAVAGLGAMQVMMLAVGLYVGEYQGMEVWIRDFLRWICLVLAVPVVTYSAQPFFAAAWRDLRRRQLGMDVPVSLAVLAACRQHLAHLARVGEVYYDSVTMFVFFLLTGRFLEMTARHQAGQISEALVRMLPASAIRLDADGVEQVVPVAELAPGDRVLVRPGETIPADGRVEEGPAAWMNRCRPASLPLSRRRGDALIGGALNVESPLVMWVEKVGADRAVGHRPFADRAQSEKPRLALLADRIAAWFVAALLGVAAAVWLVLVVSERFRYRVSHYPVGAGGHLSLCSVLATPTAIVAATGALTRLGVLTTRGHALETLARASVIFDKTGTLTYGRPQVAAVEPESGLEARRCLALAAALERGSEHPVGRALAEAAGAAVPIATELRNSPGDGVEGLDRGPTLPGGSCRVRR